MGTALEPSGARTLQAIGWLLLVAFVLVTPPVLLWASQTLQEAPEPARQTTETPRAIQRPQSSVEPTTKPDSRADQATVHVKGIPLSLDVADTPEERSFGVQGRRSLAEGEGMLFVYDAPRGVKFARKTVPFPLDVIFVAADGHIIGIAPIDEAHAQASSPGPITHVIEVPFGWSARHGVGTGDAVTFISR